MEVKAAAPIDIDSYIAGFPSEVQKILQKIRRTIKKAVPDAREAISYQIPTFRINGKNLIHFAGYSKHVAVYPAPRGEKEFAEELSKYKGGKGTVQFQLGEAVDYKLIERIAKYWLAKIIPELE